MRFPSLFVCVCVAVTQALQHPTEGHSTNVLWLAALPMYSITGEIWSWRTGVPLKGVNRDSYCKRDGEIQGHI